MKCWYSNNRIYLAAILDGSYANNYKLKIETKHGSPISEKDVYINQGDHIFVSQIPLSFLPNYILVTQSPGDITYLLEPITENIPLSLVKIGGLRGVDANDIAHSINTAYSSVLQGLINEIVGMIRSLK